MGEVSVGSDHYSALFGVAVVLLIITLIINLSAVAILRHLKEGQDCERPGQKPFISDSVKESLSSVVKIRPVCCPARFPVHRCTLVARCSRYCWYAVHGTSAGTGSHRKHIEMISFGFIVAATVIVLAILVIILRISSSTGCRHSRGNS